MTEIRLDFRYNGSFDLSQKRTQHVVDMMRERGIGAELIREAVNKGVKKLQEDGTVKCYFRYMCVIYRELGFRGMRKIYPITVFEEVRK